MKSKGTYKKGDGLKKVIMEAKKSWHGSKKTKKASRRRKGGNIPCDDWKEQGFDSKRECLEAQ